MKVTFVLKSASFAGGVRVVATYADHLRRRGHEVMVISQPPAPHPLIDQVRSLVRRGRLHPRPSSVSYLDDLDVEHRQLSRRGPVTDRDVPDADVVVATWWETAEWVARLSPQKGAKAYFLQHYESFGGAAQRVAATWRLPMHKIVIARWLKQLAGEQFNDHDVSLVPNSVDTNLFHAPSRGKQEQPTVGMLYSTVPFKGCRFGFEVLQEVRERVPGLKLVMFGKDVPPDDLRPPTWATLELIPAQQRLREIYAQCDVWLCPSESEGFHLPSLEAMACRCPVVATRCGGPDDFVTDGMNGYLVDVGDKKRMVDRLAKVLALDETRWKRMSEAALETATSYTWKDATDRFEQALVRAVEKQQAEPVG